MYAYILLISIIAMDGVSTQSLINLTEVNGCRHQGNIYKYLPKIKEEMRLYLKEYKEETRILLQESKEETRILLQDFKEEIRTFLKDDGPKPGFLQTFTKFPDKVHPGMDLWYGGTRRGSSLEARVNECQKKCLLEPKCRAYELNKYNGVCSIQSVSMYDTPLSRSTDYLFYNRDYECGRPPIITDSTLVNRTGTTDGKKATYKRMKDGVILTYECIPGGWKLKI